MLAAAFPAASASNAALVAERAGFGSASPVVVVVLVVVVLVVVVLVVDVVEVVVLVVVLVVVVLLVLGGCAVRVVDVGA
jgi:hypothetical protein